MLAGCTTTTRSARSGFEVPAEAPEFRGIARWTTSEQIRPTMGVAPEYPANMLDRQRQGEVTLKVVVRNTGQVAVVEVVSATNDDFQKSAVNGTRGILYDPVLSGQVFEVSAVYRVQKRQ